MEHYIKARGELDSALELIKDSPEYMVDCETNGLYPLINDILLLQVGTKEHQLVIDYHYFKKEELQSVRDVIGDSLILGHNIKFDLKFLLQKLGWEFETVYDTMIADKLIYAGYPMYYRFSLKDVLKRHLKIVVDKDTRKEFIDAPVGAGFSSEAITYSAKDVEHLSDVRERQLKLINRLKLNIVTELEMATLPPLARVELRGFKIDVEGWKELIAEGKKESLELEKTLNSMAKQDINWNSPKQVVAIINHLYPEAKIDSSNAETLEKHSHLPLVDTLRRFRKHSKFLSSFGDKLLEKLPDGRLRTHYGLVATGRMSSSDPNIQQMPSTETVRSKFIADYGYDLITADYGSQELVILASNSKEPAWIEALKTGQDLHSISASMLYRTRWTDAEEEGCEFKSKGKKCACEKHKEMRNSAKAISFSLAYGAGSFALSKNLGITEMEAENLMEDFFAALPNVHDYLEDAGRFANDYAYSVTNKPIERRRFYPFFGGLSYGAINRRGKNSVIQGTASDQTKLALINIDRRIREENWDAHILAIVHDEIVSEAAEDISKEFAVEVVKKEMELAGKWTLKNNLLKTEPSIGKVWKK